MIYSVRHRTVIRYASPVSEARFNLRLQPAPWRGLSVRDIDLAITPAPRALSHQSGPYLVENDQMAFAESLLQLEIVSSFVAEVAPPDLPHEGPNVSELRRAALTSRDLSMFSPAPYLFASRIARPSAAIGEWAEGLCPLDVPVLVAARTLASHLHGCFAYTPGRTTSETPPEEAFAARHGVCQDFAHILVVALRWLGIPAAYASGYLRTLPPEGQPRLVGADAMHAWVNVWCGDELGWIGIDPTNDCLALANHVQIAMGRDYADVSPIDGTFIGDAPQTMTSGVDVIQI